MPIQWDRCGTNYTMWDNGLADGSTVAYTHLVCSGISAACCLVVLGLSACLEPVRRFPKNMLLWKTACDLVASANLIGLNAALVARGEDYRITGHEICAVSLAGHYSLSAFVTGASAIASPGWFLCIAVNLNRSLHDPFTRPRSRMANFHLWVWSSSIAVGVAVSSMGDYRPNLHTCFVCHVPLPSFADSLTDWTLLFAWVVAYWLYAVAVLVDAWRRLVGSRRNWTQRVATRLEQLETARTYVAIISVQWVFMGLVFGVIFVQDDTTPRLHPHRPLHLHHHLLLRSDPL